MKVVIMSKNRPDAAKKTQGLYVNSDMCVAESEYDAYLKVGCENVTTHPDSVTGVGPVRQWILDNYSDDVLFISDDDIKDLWCNMGISGYHITDPHEIMNIIANTANCAYDLGLHVFGFNPMADNRKYVPTKPFTLCSWLGGAIGFVGRRDYRYSDNKLRADIDYCIESILHDRIIFVDSRYSLIANLFSMKGGNSEFRSKITDKDEIKCLLRKWGKYLNIVVTKRNSIRLTLNIERTLKIKLD